jgi:hypothetical protein
VDLSGVQAALSSYFPCYVTMLRWSQHDNVITAVPKRELSDQAFKLISKAFKQCGGKYVRRNGVSYFELVVKQGAEQSGFRPGLLSLPLTLPLAGAEGQFSPRKPEPVFIRLQNQLSSLANAGRQCTEA